MLRKSFLILSLLAMASPARADDWADGLFEELTCDFGAVPHGQMLIHSFRIVNNTKDTVHIGNVRTSCSGPRCNVLQYTLAPGQETAIVARVDSERFTGVRAQNIFVLIDSPRLAEVRLAVQANSRTELNFEPQSLDFAKIKHGSTPSAALVVTFMGQPKIQVTEVKSDSNFIQVTVKELRRNGDNVIYQVSAKARADMPEGKWFSDVWLSTNNAAMSRVRVPVFVEVEPK